VSRRVRAFCLIVLGLALLLAALSPLASGRPDGLERVVSDHGPARPGEQPAAAPMGDYKAPGVGDETLATILAGLAGVLVVLGVSLAVGRLIGSRRKAALVEDKCGETPTSS